MRMKRPFIPVLNVSIATHRNATAPKKRPVVYIAGPITNEPDYKRNFNQAANELLVRGYIPIKPSVLPEGMTRAQYMRVCFAMIDVADAVLFLPGSHKSEGAMTEYGYCKYIGKPTVHGFTKLEEVTKQ